MILVQHITEIYQYKIIMTVNFVVKQGCSLHQLFFFFLSFFLAGWDFREKGRGATRMLRTHEGGNGVKKVEKHCLR